MTVASEVVQKKWTGNGTAGPYNFNVPFIATSHVVVELVEIATGTRTPQVAGTHYNITGTAVNNRYPNGADITFTSGNFPSSSYYIIAYRDTELEQPTDYIENDSFPAETHEGALDRLAYQVIEISKKVARSILFTRDSEVTDQEFPNFTASDVGKALVVNATNNGVSLSTNTVDGVVTAAEAAQTAAEAAQTAAETAQTNAETAETNAETAETNASASATLAQQWANEDEDVVVSGGEYSAKHYSLKAAASAALLVQNNYSATVAPTVNDDSDDGYTVGSRWVDTVADEAYLCVDATVGAAVWIEVTLQSAELGALAILNTVGTAQIDASAITFAKLAAAVIASQAEAEAGTASNVLMTPQRVAQAIAALGTGSYTETSVSNATELDFALGSAKAYRVVFFAKAETNNVDLYAQFSSNGGSSFLTANYEWAASGRADSGTATGGSGTSSSGIEVHASGGNLGNASGEYLFGEFLVAPRGSTDDIQAGITGHSVHVTQDPITIAQHFAGSYNGTAADMDHMQLIPSSGNITGTVFVQELA